MSPLAPVPVIDRPVIVLGAGGHAKVVIAALRRLGANVRGIADADSSRAGETILGAPILGDDSVVRAQPPGTLLLVNGVGSTSHPEARRRLYETFTADGYAFAAVVDPLAVIAGPVDFGAGAQVLAGAVIQPGVVLGANSIVNTRASIDHDCRIGAHTHIAPGATLSGGVRVGEGAHVGAGATIIQKIAVGDHSVIGAGATVVADVPAHVIAVGTPARVQKERAKP